MDNTKEMQEQEQQQAAAPQLSLNDLVAVVQLIDVVSRRGAFEGSELAVIGALRNRLEAFLKASAPKPSEVQPNPEVLASVKA
jgi:hypothetical protein